MRKAQHLGDYDAIRNSTNCYPEGLQHWSLHSDATGWPRYVVRLFATLSQEYCSAPGGIQVLSTGGRQPAAPAVRQPKPHMLLFAASKESTTTVFGFAPEDRVLFEK